MRRRNSTSSLTFIPGKPKEASQRKQSASVLEKEGDARTRTRTRRDDDAHLRTRASQLVPTLEEFEQMSPAERAYQTNITIMATHLDVSAKQTRLVSHSFTAAVKQEKKRTLKQSADLKKCVRLECGYWYLSEEESSLCVLERLGRFPQPPRVLEGLRSYFRKKGSASSYPSIRRLAVDDMDALQKVLIGEQKHFRNRWREFLKQHITGSSKEGFPSMLQAAKAVSSELGASMSSVPTMPDFEPVVEVFYGSTLEKMKSESRLATFVARYDVSTTRHIMEDFASILGAYSGFQKKTANASFKEDCICPMEWAKFLYDSVCKSKKTCYYPQAAAVENVAVFSEEEGEEEEPLRVVRAVSRAIRPSAIESVGTVASVDTTLSFAAVHRIVKDDLKLWSDATDSEISKSLMSNRNAREKLSPQDPQNPSWSGLFMARVISTAKELKHQEDIKPKLRGIKRPDTPVSKMAKPAKRNKRQKLKKPTRVPGDPLPKRKKILFPFSL